jgi:glucosyl-dolichyl phosphate glucuronosyltransferase
MTGDLTVAVVICCYTEDRWEQTLAAVRSVRQQTVPVADIVVVVDHNPALASRLAVAGSGARVLSNTGPGGLSGARNTGVDAVEADIVAFLDDDAVAEPEWLSRLTEPYGDARVLGVGGHVQSLWTDGRPAWFPPEFDWVVGCSYRGMPSTRSAVRNVIGAGMSFRRERLLAAGGFDTALGRVGRRPVGCEETELCIRMQQHDPSSHIVYEPAAVVHHHVPQARTSWTYFRSRCFAEGLSKAAVTRRVGAEPGLATERTYLGSAITHGFTESVRAVARGHRDGAGVAAALCSGVALTAAGYVTGLCRPIHPSAQPLAAVIDTKVPA